MRRTDRLQNRVAVIFSAIVILALLLSVFTYLRGRSVNESTAGFVDEDLPTFASLFDLKLAVINEEPILYDYYVTRDRQRFQANHRDNTDRIDRGLAVLKRSRISSEQLQVLEGHYLKLRSLAKDLDSILSLKSVNAGKVQRLLLEISTHAAQINRAADRILETASANVDHRSRSTRHEVASIVSMVVAFSVATLLLLVAVGYSVRAYVREAGTRRQLALFPERNPHPILSVRPDGTPVYANPGAQKMLAECGVSSADLARLLPPDLVARLDTMRAKGLGRDRLEYAACGLALTCEIHPLPDYELFHVYLSDVSEQKRAEQRLIHHAYHDSLTGLPNRYRFQEMLAAALQAPAAGGVLLLSVDRFRLFVDSFGQSTGDELLKAVANRLSQALDASRADFPASHMFRTMGTQFAVLTPGLRSVAMLDALAQVLQESASQPIPVKAHDLVLSISIGGSLFPLHGSDSETVVRNADRALQSIRKQGGNAYCRYGPHLDAQYVELLELETALRLAQERNELSLHFQPQVHISTGTLIGFEALLRWHHPVHGAVHPQRVITLAEETGLIVSIGEWVLRSACNQARAWVDAGIEQFAVGVNVSARQFAQGDLPRTVRRVLQETDLDPACLELEVTESVAMHDVERTIETLAALRDIGVKLSIDDFGTGYSSLSYLKRFPVHRLKIDQSFVRNVVSDPSDAAITRAVIAMARNLNLGVIAEGVETEAQRALLERYGCHEIQGYLIARPAPAADLVPFLQACRATRSMTPLAEKRKLA